MKARHQVSRNAIELIKRFEGYRQTAARLADERWTIGFGHTLTAREGACVSPDDAEALLMYDLIAVAHAVNEHSYAPLNQNQFDALTSFAFNIGVENFRRSAVLRRLNEGALIQAACAMEMWRKADFAGERIVIDALVRRRSAEKNLFLTPPEGWVAAPSPILPPKVDYDASFAVPRQTPASVTGSLDGDRAEPKLVADPGLAVLVPPDEEAEPTASERAAAAVGARLEALLPDALPMPEAPALADTSALDVPLILEPDHPPSAASTTWPSPFVVPTLDEQAELDVQAWQPAKAGERLTETGTRVGSEAPFEPRPLPADWPVGETVAATEAAQPLLDAPSPNAQSHDSHWPVRIDEINGAEPAVARSAKPRRRRAAPLLVGGSVSLVVFAGGVFGGLNAVPDATGTILTVRAVSWALCVIGAVGLVVYAYRLLRLLDVADED